MGSVETLHGEAEMPKIKSGRQACCVRWLRKLDVGS